MLESYEESVMGTDGRRSYLGAMGLRIQLQGICWKETGQRRGIIRLQDLTKDSIPIGFPTRLGLYS